ncbi:MAG: glycosyltransferase family protein [Clostridium sp.]|nr:glycosyltransferase family protein [Clostridium sp.]
MKYLAIIQARMGSSRLPNKVLRPLCGRPMLQHIVSRMQKSECIDHIMVATTVKEDDNAIEELCRQIQIECYRGSENDVLDRYYQAASRYKPQNVVRITADCPFIDPVVVDHIIQIHEKGGYDYTSNVLVETYPDGLDTEVFKISALERAWREANLASEREHVTPYIKCKGEFKRYSVERSPSLATKRWTVDTEADFALAVQVYNALYDQDSIFLMEDILKFLENHQQIERLNENIVRNEGYLKSVAHDYIIRED